MINQLSKNLTMLVALFTALFSRLVGRRWGSLTVIVVIILYAILVAGSATVVWTAIMVCLSLLVVQPGRKQDGLIILEALQGYTLLRTDRNG